MGVVIRRYIVIITYPYSTCISFFCGSIPTLFILKMFFALVYVIFVQYSKRCAKNIRDRSKIEIREHGDIIILTRMYVDCTRV